MNKAQCSHRVGKHPSPNRCEWKDYLLPHAFSKVSICILSKSKGQCHSTKYSIKRRFQKDPLDLQVTEIYLLAQPCLSLCDLVDCSPPDSSVHGIFQVRILVWVVISSSRGSSQGAKLCLLHLLYLDAHFLPLSHLGCTPNDKIIVLF